MRRQNTRKYIELTYLLFIVGIAIIFMSIYFTERIFSNNYILSEGFFRNVVISSLLLCVVDIGARKRLNKGKGGYFQFGVVILYFISSYILWGVCFAIVDAALTAMHIGYIFSYSFITASAIFIATVIVSFSKKAKYSNKIYFTLSLLLLDIIIIDIINYFLGWNWGI